MPELPEVETVKRGLHKLVVGKVIKSVTHNNPKSFPNSKTDVTTFLIGSSIIDVRRRAKVLIIDLDTDYSLVVHLKMTGQLVFVAEQQTGQRAKSREQSKNSEVKNGNNDAAKSITYNLKPITSSDEVRFGAGHPNDSLIGKLPDKSTRVEITFSDDSKLFFNDQRKFGWMRLLPTIEVPNIDFMKRVGPEPLEETFTPKVFIQRIRKRNNSVIKAAILDQTVLAGVGNIYADESLWGAKIHPVTRVKDVSDERLKKLHYEIRYVLNLSIEKGGSTNKNYVNAEGKRGSYTDFARVFRREGQDCPIHPGTAIIKIRVAGRGTHICLKCQKI